MNLLTNAVKFTEPGGRIELWWESSGGDVLLHVRDTGIGIAPDRQEQVFEPFVQLRASRDQRHGTGLGLAISRELARGMGGDLRLVSDEHVGSTFTLVLRQAAQR